MNTVSSVLDVDEIFLEKKQRRDGMHYGQEG